MERIILLEFYQRKTTAHSKHHLHGRGFAGLLRTLLPLWEWRQGVQINLRFLHTRKARRAKIKETVQHLSLEMNLCFGTKEVEPLRFLHGFHVTRVTTILNGQTNPNLMISKMNILFLGVQIADSIFRHVGCLAFRKPFHFGVGSFPGKTFPPFSNYPSATYMHPFIPMS